jgi:chromosome segregation ATPase
VLRDRLARATEPVDDWIEAIYRLATRLDAYERNRVLKQDLHSVPLAIENFKQRLAQENDPAVLQTLRNTIVDKERQWEYLSKLQNTMENAEYQMESTLAALGTVYAQLQTLDLRGAEKGHADRLRQEIDEQVAQLQDLSEAMDEVYQAGS